MKLKLTLLTVLFLASGFFIKLFPQSKKRSFFEIKVYHLKDQAQETLVEEYLKSAFIPALKRSGIKTIGVFKPLESDTLRGKRIYVLIPFKSAAQFAGIDEKLDRDQLYHEDGSSYLNVAYSNPPYKRIESIFIKAFTHMPHLAVPSLKNEAKKRVYELRSYEGPTEKLYQNKVHMFNEGGEVTLFKRLGFNAVFYGSVLSGSRMPNLMYMTSFEDMASRDLHWKAFNNDPEWKRLSAMDFYQHNVSKGDIWLLYPTDYSGI